jgi:hypothetical protein
MQTGIQMTQISNEGRIVSNLGSNIRLAAAICLILIVLSGPSYASQISNSAPAGLNGLYKSQGVDDDGNGLFDHIDIEIGIDVRTPGRYRVNGSLYDDGGNETVPASNEAQLSIGAKYITLQFYGLQRPGAYHLRNVTLYDDQNQLLESSGDAYTTKGYFSIDSNPQLGKLSGEYSDRGVDENGDGKFELLDVDVGVRIFFPGQYTLTGYLYDKNGSEIGWAIDNGDFEAGNGTMHLKFDGMPIEQHRADGPFTLGKLFLAGENWRIKDVANNVYNTFSYKYSDFAPRVLSHNEKLISGIGYGELWLAATIHTTVPVSSGTYSYDIESIDIPPISSNFNISFPYIRTNVYGRNVSGYAYNAEGVYIPALPNNFTVSASGVKTLNVGLKKLQGSYKNSSTVWKELYARIWITDQVNADKDARAMVTNDYPSPGSYHAKIFGDAANNVSMVDLTMTVVKELVVNGHFDLRINTTGFPEGDYLFNIKALNGTFKMDEMSFES